MTLTKSNKVKASELFSVLLHLSEECCRLLDEVHSSQQQLQTQMKDPENPVTIADLTIQKTIEHILLSFYPKINIIGEEDPSTYEHIKPLVNVSEVRKDTITDEFLAKNFESRRELISQSKTSSLFTHIFKPISGFLRVRKMRSHPKTHLHCFFQ